MDRWSSGEGGRTPRPVGQSVGGDEAACMNRHSDAWSRWCDSPSPSDNASLLCAIGDEEAEQCDVEAQGQPSGVPRVDLYERGPSRQGAESASNGGASSEEDVPQTSCLPIPRLHR